MRVYYHVIADGYAERDIELRLFYTVDGVYVSVDSMPIEELEQLLSEHLHVRQF